MLSPKGVGGQQESLKLLKNSNPAQKWEIIRVKTAWKPKGMCSHRPHVGLPPPQALGRDLGREKELLSEPTKGWGLSFCGGRTETGPKTSGKGTGAASGSGHPEEGLVRKTKGLCSVKPFPGVGMLLPP